MTQQDTRQDAIEKEPRDSTQSPNRFNFKRLIISGLAAIGAGLTASLLAVVLMGILRLAAGIPTPVELFGDFVLKHINVDQFIRLLSQFSANPKTGPLGLTLLAMIGVGTAASLLYALLVHLSLPTSGYRPSRREWIIALALGLAMSAVGIVLFWDELRQNFFGIPIDAARFVTAFALVADFMLYGVALCLVFRILLPKQAVATATGTGATNNRRQLFARAGVAVLGLGAGAGTLGLMRGFLNNYSSYDGMQTFTHNNVTAPITTNSEHYVVTQNAVDPSVNTSVWSLEITGLVGNSGSYTYEEIQKLPSTSRAITLECIANYTSGTGGHLISTAIWQGVTFSTLLLLHGGAQAGARYATFSSVDDYTVSLPLDEVLAADALLAWRMNGAELPQRHGYPMRVLIPGRYGEENPKWLTRIELTDHFVGGLYSDQGWYNGPLHTMSRIDRPRGRLAVGQPVEIGGISFAGNRGIQQVEVSTDGGLTWNLAQLKEQISLDAWVLWTYEWTPLLSGPYKLTARATDGTGTVQTDKIQGTVPNGATGYPAVMVEVV